ncbi:MAG: YkvA family protein [Desulfovibrionales bacterium]
MNQEKRDHMTIADKLKGINRRFIQQGAERIGMQDLDKAKQRAGEILSRFENNEVLGKSMAEARLLMGLVGDYRAGRYKKIPWWAVSSVVFALLYVLNPFDLVPDFIPVLGQLDDALVLGLCLRMVEREITAYKEWKEGQQKEEIVIQPTPEDPLS